MPLWRSLQQLNCLPTVCSIAEFSDTHLQLSGYRMQLSTRLCINAYPQKFYQFKALTLLFFLALKICSYIYLYMNVRTIILCIECNSDRENFGKWSELKLCTFLNQVRTGQRPACAWFLEIVFVQMSVCVCVCVCVRACVCVYPPPGYLKLFT